MTVTIQTLLIILLSLSIFAVIRLWSVLGSVRVTLANLETTRQEADRTLQRLSEVALATDRVMREEVAPTLQMTRATLENVEITTRALAQTTQAIGRLTGRAESLTSAQRLLALGGTVAQGVFGGKANKTGAGASHNARLTGFQVAFAVASRLRGLFGRRAAIGLAVEERENRQIEPLRALQEGETRNLHRESHGADPTQANGTEADDPEKAIPLMIEKPTPTAEQGVDIENRVRAGRSSRNKKS